LILKHQILLNSLLETGEVGRVEEKDMRHIKMAGLILCLCLAMVLPASAMGRFRGGIAVFPAFSPWGWGPYPYGVYAPYEVYTPVYSNAGEVELKTNVKDADVFINGAYAGKAAKLKSMWLFADAYALEVRAPGRTPFKEKIYVIPGKTIKVEADFPTTPIS
jgi:hypothetical protein